VYGAWGVLCRAAPTPTVVKILVDDVNATKRGLPEACTLTALGRAGPLAKDAVPGLLRLADRGSEAAAVALGRIGPDAAAAIPALTALRDKGDETIRVPAAQALRRIRAKK
jgi:hypothetical protein